MQYHCKVCATSTNLGVKRRCASASLMPCAAAYRLGTNICQNQLSKRKSNNVPSMSSNTVSTPAQSTAEDACIFAYDTWMRDLSGLTLALMPIVEQASAAIMRIYDGEFAVERKDDNSPLTLADLESHRVIIDGLKRLTPEIPILSEESAAASWAERRTWHDLWVVDPLDGTREFVKRNGEFTINIALVVQHEPVLGVVCAPAQRVTYWGAAGDGAFKRAQAETHAIHTVAPQQP